MAQLPDFEAWAIFARVAELGSFSRTAAELSVSKATVSKALTRLEARLGTPLFHRSSRRLSLTESGRASLDRARRILAEGEAAEDEATEQTREPRGLVRLTAPVSFGIQNLGPVLAGFLARYPEVTLDLQITDRWLDLVAEGVDVALRIGVLGDSALRARQLYTMRLMLVAAPALVARLGPPSHPRDLQRYPAFLFTQLPQPAIWPFHHAQEGELGVRMTGRVWSDNADVLLPALLAGAGVSLLPEFLAWQPVRDGSLLELLSDWTITGVALHVVTPPGTVRPARVTALIEYLSEHLRQPRWIDWAR